MAQMSCKLKDFSLNWLFSSTILNKCIAFDNSKLINNLKLNETYNKILFNQKTKISTVSS